MKTFGELDAQVHVVLTSALVEVDWPASRPSGFTPGVKSPIPIGQEAAWAPEPVWTIWRNESS
jgi:hypothetical protein